MKILVCISKVPDTTARISFKDNDTIFDAEGVQFILNPYDEWYALVKALEIKESQGGEVVVIHVGDSASDSVIRKALAIGADRAIRIDKAPEDSLDVATQVAAAIGEESFDIIFTGKETIEFNSSEMGSMLAGLLDLPFVSYASEMEMAEGTATIVRDAEGYEERVVVKAPMVVSASKGLAEQRIPNMRGIMMAKRKPLDVVPPVDYTPRTSIVSFFKPKGRSTCTFIDADNIEELVRILNEELKVI